MIIIEYIWLDCNQTTRSKTKVMKFDLNLINDNPNLLLEYLPTWNFDGSSTGQATTRDSEILLKPIKCVLDSFRREKNCFLVLCECMNIDGAPNKFNTRALASQIFNHENAKSLEPIFGLEQEFFISNVVLVNDTITYEPLSLSIKNFPKGLDGDYYCGNGFNNAVRRDIIEDALSNLIYSGIKITGLNAEVSPSQWEFQVCSKGIDAPDSLILLRYICNRTFEKYNVIMDLSVKPRKELNGSGCHVNFSTKQMRANNGYNLIKLAIDNLSNTHDLHIKYYGSDNEKRLTGIHETSSINKFSYGIGSRDSSIRIPNDTFKKKKGYFEDRRPSSTMDPYIVTSLLFATSCKIPQNIFT